MALQVEPSEIRFDNVLPGTLYVMTFSVRNLSQTAQRIRLSTPKSGLFALNYIPAGAVAPGLDLRAEIECQIPSELTDFVFTDKIIATMGNERAEISISALKPHARIKFDKSLGFGNILLKQSLSKDLYFTNTSDIGGVMKLTTNRGSQLKMSTNRLDFKPRGQDGSVLKVSFTIEGREVGMIREFVKVQMAGSVDEMHIDISAQVIEQNLTLLSENQQGTLDIAKFGNIFFGEVKTVQSVLVNSGPLPLSFTVKYEDEEEANNPQSGIMSSTGDSGNSLEQFYTKSLTISPVDGIVKPFSQVTMTITFQPVIAVPEKGFIQQHLKDYEEARIIQRMVKIECLDSMQTINLQMIGHAHIPAMGINPAILRFGDCPVNDRRDILVTLSNRSKLPLAYEFPVVATFKFHPLKGRVMPHEHVSIVASFLPPQLGLFKTQVPLIIGGGLKQYDIKVVGTAESVGGKKLLITGTDKLPEDFVPHYKFVDPEEEATARLERRQAKEMKAQEIEATLRTMLSPSLSRKKMFQLEAQPKPVKLSDLESVNQPPIIQAASESDDIYGTNAETHVKRDVNEEEEKAQRLHEQYQRDMYDMTRKHNKGYNDYLQKSHQEREIRRLAKLKAKSLQVHGAIDFSDPFGVNMGMDRGLEEPTLRVPVADEPLWTTTGAAAASSVAGGPPRRMPTDENRLIQKKYPTSPATQAELRDCSKELSTDDLKLVSASHKTIDYGKVCVGSVTAKNFVVFNNLHHSIIVTIEDLEIELQQSKALTQVIPPNCMAGFDMYFSSRVVGKVKKTFTWKVNHIHMFKVVVAAEVIPIELIMNKQELNMEFPIDSLRPTLTTEIILTNPGNAHADFLWGSVGAFVCDPEKGAIAPGKSSVVSITWDPLCGKRAEEEIGLHITGGIDQVLKVRGILKDTRGEFADKRLNLGKMAVGTEREFITSINNTGEHELVYFISPMDDSLGIRIEPTEAMILPGESGEIKVTVTPKTARNYDNTTVHAKIRGGKSISMKFVGSSIIPEIEIPESTLPFGSVTVGSHIRLPLTIRNRSPITATLLLDLSNYEDFSPNLLHPIEEVDIATQENGPVASLQEDDYGNSLMLYSRAGFASKDDSPSITLGKKGAKVSSPRSSRKKKQSNNLWKISILANAVLEAELIFRPTNAKRYSFRLPINLFGIVEDRSLQRECSAVGIASVLRLSNTVVDFGDRVVARDPLARVSYFMETTITNQSNTGVSFAIREGDEIARNFDGSTVDLADQKAQQQKNAKDDGMVGAEPQQIFFVSPLSLDLAPGASMKVRVTFLPQQNVNYSKKLGFFRKDPGSISQVAIDPNQRPYLSLLCVGTGVYPCMTFSQQHVRLPTVPLGITSRASFFIHNNGYAALEVRHRSSPNITVPLEISYPDGNQLGIMIDKIRVVVSAKADSSASWSGKIEFYDNDGERFFVTLSGLTDNCLLTNYPFVQAYSPEYGFIGVDDQPVQFLPQHQISELRQWEAKRKEEMRRLRSLERQRLVEGKKNEPETQSQVTNKKSVKIKEEGSISTHGGAASPGSKKSKLSRKDSQRSFLSDGSGENSNGQPAFLEGIDLDKPVIPNAIPEDQEAIFLLTWLNRTVCRRPFDTSKYPYCMFDSAGDLAVDCIEQMSGKKIPNLKGDPNQLNGRDRRKASDTKTDSDVAVTKRSSEKSKLIAAADKMVFKFQQVLNFLVSHGALLAHINPIVLLNQPEYMLMQEYDLSKDKSIRLTPSALNARKEYWQESWIQSCSSAWLEVMYQAVKTFILSRLNLKEFSTLPGVVITNRPDAPPPPPATTKATNAGNGAAAAQGKKKEPPGKDGKDKEKKQPIPRDLQASNVFTHGEAILLAWASYHLDHANNVVDDGANAKGNNDFKLMGLNKRVYDLDATFRDFYSYCQLLHSHVGVDITVKGEPLRGYTSMERSRQEELYVMFEEALNQYHCNLDVTADDILKSTRNILLMLLHLYLSLPHLIPKTKIDFTGILGEPIGKRIEIKNTAKKPLLYQVSLRGCEDFVPDAAQLLVPAESSTDFLVTLNARFQHQVKTKLYFWNVREPAYAPGATLCFQCVSDIRGVKPLDAVVKEMGLFDYEIFHLPVKNPHNREVTFQVKYEVRYCAKSVDDVLHKNVPEPHSKRGKKPTPEVWETIPLTRPEIDEDAAADPFGFDFQNNPPPSTQSKLKGDEWELENMCRQPFWMNEENLTLPKNGSKNVSVFMLPFLMGKYICQICFYEPELGEFCYEIRADVGLPRCADKIDTSVFQGNTSYLGISFNAKNVPFEKAFTVLTDVRVKNANKKIKARAVLQNYMAATVTREETGQANFVLDFTAPFFLAKKSFAHLSEYLRWPNKAPGGNSNASKVKKVTKTSLEMLPGPEEDVPAGNAAASAASFNSQVHPQLSRAVLSFQPVKAGQYHSIVVLYPEDNPHDIRCVELNVLAKVPDARMTLEFKGPARKSYVQEIPVSNETDAEWLLSVTVLGKGFTSDKVLTVPAHGHAVLQVRYFPLSAGYVEGKLQLRNAETNDMFEYALIGSSEDALAEANLTFKCHARKKTSFQINLPSLRDVYQGQITSEKVFTVETDLPYTFCPETCTLYPDDNEATCEFTVNSPLGGKLIGSVTFTDPESGACFWYAVTVTVASPTEEKSIDVTTTVRQGCIVDITLANPLDEELTFDVTFIGDGLQGSATYTLPAKSQQANKNNNDTAYELIYSPLIAGNFFGKVNFANESVGELWYKLVLTALPAPPVPLEPAEVMLGSEVALAGSIVENPLGEAVVFAAETSDSEHFLLPQAKISVPPYGSALVPITFRPSSLGDTVEADVVLTNRKLGEVRFRCTGRGLLPGVMPMMNIDGPLQEIVSQSILFRNPFTRPLSLEVVLSVTGSALNINNSNSISHSNSTSSAMPEEIFSLLLRKRTDLVIAPKTVFHIPVAFAPQVMGVFSAMVTVRSNMSGHDLLWCYPLQGTAEVGQVHKIPAMSTPAKTSLVKEHVIPLAGLPVQLLHDHTNSLRVTEFAVSLDIDDGLKNLVLRTFKLQPLEIVALSEDTLGLRCRLIFEPLRVYGTTVQISLVSKARGKWRAKIDLDALDPAPDDTIRLTAAAGSLDRVSFPLHNRFLGYSSFQAFFASHSSPHFSVEPKSGVLAPHDRGESTTFVVTFAPKEYGAIEQGTLHILTDDAQWTYVVKGTYPETVNGVVRKK